MRLRHPTFGEFLRVFAIILAWVALAFLGVWLASGLWVAP